MSMRFVERTTAAGLRVLVEELPAARSAAAGFFVATGSRDEPPGLMGVSHFLEHMAFKATRKRSALEVSRVLDAMGSRANAYTSWERTVFYAQLLPEFCSPAVALLAEMIDPALLDEDFTVEKNVILEEIEMYNDRPEFLLMEALMEKRYGAHPLAGRILGTRETIGALASESMRGYHAGRYQPDNLLLAVAGRVAAAEVFGWAESLEWSLGRGATALPAGAAVGERGRGHVAVTRPGDTLQHYLAAWVGPANPALRDRYTVGVLSLLLGDAEGSRFAWALTHPGLAESADAGALPFRDEGILYAGFSARPDHYDRCREILLAEIARLKREPPDAAELERARTKFASRTILAAESTMGRMIGLGGDGIDGIPYHSLEDELKIILSITAAEVLAWAERMGEPETTATIGPLEEKVQF